MTDPPGRMPLDLPPRWIHGSRPGGPRTDPRTQVHTIAPGTVVIRQSKDDTFEAPFLLLLLGRDRALLIDTGATEGSGLRGDVDRLVTAHVAAAGDDRATPYELVVLHSHGHGDHVAGDAAFRARPHTTVVGADLAAVTAHLGITDWPSQVVALDLGARIVDVVGVPGHHAASIAVHDRETGLLHTGDTVYPGRLYVEDAAAMRDSLERLVVFAEERGVTSVLGAHVEMTATPGVDYPLGCRHQPDEPSPLMTVEQLVRVREQVRAVVHRPGVHRFDDVVVCVGSGPRVLVPLYARGAVARARRVGEAVGWRALGLLSALSPGARRRRAGHRRR